MPANAVTATPVVTENTYKIVYNWTTKTSWTMSDDTWIKYTQNKTLKKNTYVKTWYTFMWWSDINGWAVNYQDEATVNRLVATNWWTKTLHAVWKANRYLVSLNYNDGMHWAADGVEMEYDSWSTIVNPTRAGYIFSWWNITWMDGETHTIGAWTTNTQSVMNEMSTQYLNLNATSWSVVTFQAQWIPRTDTKYMVYHYLKEVWKDTYELLDAYTETYYWTSDAEITLADYKKVSSELWWCGTYTSWSLESSVNGPSTVITTTTIWADWETKIYLYYTRSKYRVELWKDAYIQAVWWDWLYECWAKITVTANPMEWYHFRRWRIEWEGELEEKEDDNS